MTSLRQVLATHDTALVLDAASSRIQIGWLSRNRPPRWQTSDEEAGTGIFQSIEALGVNVAEAAAFIYCDGPGSILGIRTVSMAIRAWNVLTSRPVFGYCSLALVAHRPGQAGTAVIADARRDSWHYYRGSGPLRRIAATDLTGELVMPEHFRNWSALPPGLRIAPYSVAELLPATADLDLLQRTDAPDAFLHEEPSYVRWTPQIHRAPNST